MQKCDRFNALVPGATVERDADRAGEPAHAAAGSTVLQAGIMCMCWRSQGVRAQSDWEPPQLCGRSLRFCGRISAESTNYYDRCKPSATELGSG